MRIAICSTWGGMRDGALLSIGEGMAERGAWASVFGMGGDRLDWGYLGAHASHCHASLMARARHACTGLLLNLGKIPAQSGARAARIAVSSCAASSTRFRSAMRSEAHNTHQLVCFLARVHAVEPSRDCLGWRRTGSLKPPHRRPKYMSKPVPDFVETLPTLVEVAPHAVETIRIQPRPPGTRSK